jgi:hypothetical protein
VGDGNPERSLPGKVRNVVFRDLEVESEAGILNWAADPSLIQNILYQNVILSIGTQSKWNHRIDLKPNDLLPVVERPHNAFEAVNVSDIEVDNLKIVWDKESRGRYGNSLFVDSALGFKAKTINETIE